MNNIGRIISSVREKRGMLQGELAEKLDVSVNYVSQIENGRKEPGVQFVSEVARVLQIPVILLLLEKVDIPEGKTEKEKELRVELLDLAKKARALLYEES